MNMSCHWVPIGKKVLERDLLKEPTNTIEKFPTSSIL